MNPTMLWFDNDPKTTPEQKIIRAVEYYRFKYKREPNLAQVHADQLEKVTTGVQGVSIETKSYIRPHDFHIGIRDGNSDHLRQNQLLDTK